MARMITETSPRFLPEQASVRSIIFSLSLVAIALALGTGCGGGKGTATPTQQKTTGLVTAAARGNPATQTHAAVPSTATPTDIRGLDLNSQAQASLCGTNTVKPFSTPSCLADTIYADLIGDGGEEAIVTVFSGGTAGNIGVVVFGYVGGVLRELLRELPPAEAYSGHIQASLSSSGQLAIRWPIYRQGEPNCCPTGGMRTRYYRWDGGALVLDRETILPQGQTP